MIRRIYLGGLACALVATAIGIGLERARFGSSEADAFARVEGSVRSEIAGVVSSLSEIASSVGREPALFDAAAADPAGARALFDLADQSLQGRTPGVFAVTAYRASGSGTPLAWSGRPSEISVERLSESEALFVESGPLGLRLIYVRPVTDASTGHRLGMIAAERVLSASHGIREASSEVVLSIPTIVPVTVRPHDATRPADGNTVVVQSPTNEPLLDARLSPEGLQAARAKWRGDIAAVVLGILALTLIVSIPPLLGWRETTRTGRDQVSVLGIVVAALVSARVLLWLAPTVTWTDQVFHTEALAPPLRALLRSPVDFLLTMLLFAALVTLGLELTDRLRRAIQHRRPPPRSNQEWATFAVSQLAAGALVALLVVGYEVVLGDAISATSVDALHFSLHPWVTARVAFAIAVILAQAVVVWTGSVRPAAHIAAVAHSSHRPGGRCGRSSAGTSGGGHCGVSPRDRRCALDRAPVANSACGPCVHHGGVDRGVGAASIPARLAGAAIVCRGLGAVDARVRPLPVGLALCRSRGAPADRGRVWAAGLAAARPA